MYVMFLESHYVSVLDYPQGNPVMYKHHSQRGNDSSCFKQQKLVRDLDLAGWSLIWAWILH